MTKKHFEALAKTIQEEVKKVETKEARDQIERIAYKIGGVAAETNPRFNSNIFIKACGL